jgi:antitoxin CptB
MSSSLLPDDRAGSATDRGQHIPAKRNRRKSRFVVASSIVVRIYRDAVETVGLTFSVANAISTPPGTSGLLAFEWIGTMTGTTRSSGGLDDRRKRLLFRCWHRGTREMDLILGRFADAEISALGDDELAELERLLELPDPDLYAAVIGDTPLDPSYATALFDRIKAFRAVDHGA